MFEIITATLVGALVGAITSPLLHKYLQRKLARQTSLTKGGFMKIYLPNGYVMTIWDSNIRRGQVCACVHHDNKDKVTDGEIVYFNKNYVSHIKGVDISYDRKEQ